VYAQNDEVAVKQVVNRLFDGMKKSDTAMIRSVFSSDPTLQSIATSRDGNVLIVNEPLDSFLVEISKPHTEVYNERLSFDVIKIDGELAMVWAPYKFYVGERLNHCGTDSFQLVRIWPMENSIPD